MGILGHFLLVFLLVIAEPFSTLFDVYNAFFCLSFACLCFVWSTGRGVHIVGFLYLSNLVLGRECLSFECSRPWILQHLLLVASFNGSRLSVPLWLSTFLFYFILYNSNFRHAALLVIGFILLRCMHVFRTLIRETNTDVNKPESTFWLMLWALSFSFLFGQPKDI